MANVHATPPPGPHTAPPPEPSYAERARTLVHLGRTGTLATLSRRHPGHPFASLMPYAIDGAGRPLLLISSMAVHTQNLEADGRASLLVTQAGWGGDPLAAGRVTLLGRAARVPEAEVATVRPLYLARQERAASWVGFADFRFWRLEVSDIYFVGGFAAMDWITPAAYGAAAPDPLADDAAAIIEHMNRDHADALGLYARVLALTDADEAVLTSVDRLGFKLHVRAGERRHSVRIAFPREVGTAAEARDAFIDLLRRARGTA